MTMENDSNIGLFDLNVPVFDLSSPGIISQIGEACQSGGSFQVVNPGELMLKMTVEMGMVGKSCWFMKLPTAAKASLLRLLGNLLRQGVDDRTMYYLFEKQLKHSDVDCRHNRLQLSPRDVRKPALYGLLTSREKTAIEEQESGLPVRVLDPAGREYSMTFRFYPNNLRQFRFFGSGYRRLVRENGWETGQTVQLWAFRHGGDDGQRELVVVMLNYVPTEGDAGGL